jgi:hypothetical protein
MGLGTCQSVGKAREEGEREWRLREITTVARNRKVYGVVSVREALKILKKNKVKGNYYFRFRFEYPSRHPFLRGLER